MGFIDEEAFHANDIRGIYPNEINEAIAYHVGGAFVKMTKAKEIAVGRDVRLSSHSLTRAVIAGITDAGADVLFLGVVDTPRIYFVSGKSKMPALMITASHNPAEYNGIKFVFTGAKPLISEDMKKLAEMTWQKSQMQGKLIEKDVAAEYFDYVLSYVEKKKTKPLKIVIDAGNGVSGNSAQQIFSALSAEVIPLYFEPDGSFPNHVPNPAIPSNLVDLQRAVPANKADLGISFDGDADRVLFVDELGNAVSPSATAAMMAAHLLSEQKGKVKGAIIHTAISSKVVSETIKKAGGLPLAEKIGHAFIKSRMRNEHALFGAEESGHYYFKRNFYADSAFIAAALMYEILSSSNKKMSELCAGIMKYYKPEQISLHVKDRDKAVQNIMNWCQKLKPVKKKIFDGTTFIYKDYWINVRASNTEPLVRITMESDNEKKGKAIEKTLRDFIKLKILKE
jgi:phosphomannomutase